MKKLICVTLLFIAVLSLNAQNCSVDLTIEQGKYSNSLRCLIHVDDSLTTPFAGARYRYVVDFGNGVKDSTFGNGTLYGTSYNYNYSTPGVYVVSVRMDVRDTLNGMALVCRVFDYDTLNIPAMATCSTFVQYSQPFGSKTVTFYDRSTGTSSRAFYNMYDWDFGDGSSGSTLQNPTHTYANYGQYGVTLKHSIVDSLTNIVLCTDQKTITPVFQWAPDTCKASFLDHHTPSLTVNFENKSMARFSTNPDLIETYIWDFGDGNSSTFDYPSHTYSQQGTYAVTLIMESRDSLTQAFVCSDTTTMNIQVTGVAPPTCSASYIVDTNSSGGSNINIYNTSTPSNSSPNSQIRYYWRFGDGDSSNLPFPSHTYVNPGVYRVCLRISVTDTANQTCWSSFCDTIGIDSLGNVIYKNSSTGFTLNVLDPNTVGQEEYKELNVRVYPNPTSGFVNVEGMTEVGEWALYNIQGASVAGGHLDADESRIDFGAKKQGLYILTLKSGSRTKTMKLSIK